MERLRTPSFERVNSMTRDDLKGYIGAGIIMLCAYRPTRQDIRREGINLYSNTIGAAAVSVSESIKNTKSFKFLKGAEEAALAPLLISSELQANADLNQSSQGKDDPHGGTHE